MNAHSIKLLVLFNNFWLHQEPKKCKCPLVCSSVCLSESDESLSNNYGAVNLHFSGSVLSQVTLRSKLSALSFSSPSLPCLVGQTDPDTLSCFLKLVSFLEIFNNADCQQMMSFIQSKNLSSIITHPSYCFLV